MKLLVLISLLGISSCGKIIGRARASFIEVRTIECYSGGSLILSERVAPRSIGYSHGKIDFTSESGRNIVVYADCIVR